ncbi:MAG TPA: PDDEXK nuclease domain-containing protein, partial [Gemmataceae bacterium]|nr:PDDEXK nuclease domain-containing protein [Gemmataceae bacterium]
LARLRTADQLSPDLVFRDPYLLDFLGLKDTYSEKDLEAAILREMEAFLLELGAGFTFVARQKRMVIDGKDFSLDLLFFHRKLHRLIAIDLKLGEFQPAGAEQVELLQLSESGIRLATYLTELPPKALLQKKLRAAAELARHRLKEAGQ